MSCDSFDDILKALDDLGRRVSKKEETMDESLKITKARSKKVSEKIDMFVDVVKEMGFYDKSTPNPYAGKGILEIINGMSSEFPDPGEDEEYLRKKREAEEKKRLYMEKKRKEEQERIERERQEQKLLEYERIKKEQEKMRIEQEKKRMEQEKNRMEQEKKQQVTVNVVERTSSHNDGDICFECKKPVTEHPVHVNGECWHRQCFRCSKCSKPLVKYHIEKGRAPICLECFESDKSNLCCSCGKLIGLSGHVKVGDKKYHAECFCCSFCKNMLPQRHFIENGKLYCSQECVNKSTGNVCYKCNKPLSGSIVTVGDKKYHRDCFVCTNCGSQFSELRFFPVNGKPYCESCARYLQRS